MVKTSIIDNGKLLINYVHHYPSIDLTLNWSKEHFLKGTWKVLERVVRKVKTFSNKQ